jgi:hypothetical protein
MLPKMHILSGAIFSLIIWAIFPATHWAYIILLFIGSFMMDFDHYMCAVYKTGKISLLNALEYYRKWVIQKKEEAKRGVFKKGHFHIFHTIEFHILFLILSFMWVPFAYVFVGMIFHSILDFIWLAYEKRLYIREYFLTRWLWQKLQNSHR